LLVKLTVIGGRGAWPGPDDACSGYLLEADGVRLLVDPGYGTLARLYRVAEPASIDAVVVTHGHPDHCVDLNPLLPARALGEEEVSPLPVYAPPGALDAVLGLDDMRVMDAAVDVVPTRDGDHLDLGPFGVDFAQLPHHVTNLGIRVAAGDQRFAYTGDSGPDQAVVELAQGVDLLLIEATYPAPIRDSDRWKLCDVNTALDQAAQAGVGAAMLTHLWPTVRHQDVEPLLRDRAAEVTATLAVSGTVVDHRMWSAVAPDSTG
jgi:ribonuclease BN (tRNA processing enzyme)